MEGSFPERLRKTMTAADKKQIAAHQNRNWPTPSSAERVCLVSTGRRRPATRPYERQYRVRKRFQDGKKARAPTAIHPLKSKPRFPIREGYVLESLLRVEAANRSSGVLAIVTGRQFVSRCSIAVRPANLLAQLARQINQLPNMMIGVSRAAQKNGKTLRSFRFAHCGVWLHPVLRGLVFNRRDDHRNRTIKRSQHFRLGFRFRLVSIAIAV